MAKVFDPVTNRWRDTSNGNRFTTPPGTGGTPNTPNSSTTPAGNGSGTSYFSTYAQKFGASFAGVVKSRLSAIDSFTQKLVHSSEQRVANTIKNAIVSAPRNVVGAAGVTAGAVLAVTTGVIVAFKAVTDEAGKTASALSTLRANTGLSFNTGYSLVQRNSVFGISPERTAAIYGERSMNPMLANARARSLGFSGFNQSDFFERLARVYQSQVRQGPFGRIQANARLDALYGGNAPDEVRQIANLSPEKIRNQLSYARQIQSAFGVTGETLRKFAEDIPLANQRIGFAFEQAKMKVAVLVAPFLERTLGGIATYIGRNAGKIASAIETGVSWLVEVLPVALLKGSAFILRGGSLLLRGLSFLATGIGAHVGDVLIVFQTLVDAVKFLVDGVKGAVPNVLTSGPINAIVSATDAVGRTITGKESDNLGQKVVNVLVGGGFIGVGAKIARPFIGRALTGGGAATAGKAVAPLLAPLAGPLAATGIGVGVGVGAGYLLDRYWQSKGVVNPNQSFTSRLKYGWGTFRDWWTNNPGAYDKAQGTYGTYIPSIQAGRGADKPGVMGVEAYQDQLAQRQSVAFNNPTTGSPNQPFNWGNLPSNDNILKLKGMLSDVADVTSSGADALGRGADRADSLADGVPALIAEIRKLNATTERTGKQIVDAHGRPIVLGRDVVDHIGAYIAQDAFRLARRRG